MPLKFPVKINFRNYRGPKAAILTHSEALNFDYSWFLHFLKARIYQNKKFRAPEIAKLAFFERLLFPKLISRKSDAEKFWNFHTVNSKSSTVCKLENFAWNQFWRIRVPKLIYIKSDDRKILKFSHCADWPFIFTENEKIFFIYLVSG